MSISFKKREDRNTQYTKYYKMKKAEDVLDEDVIILENYDGKVNAEGTDILSSDINDIEKRTRQFLEETKYENGIYYFDFESEIDLNFPVNLKIFFKTDNKTDNIKIDLSGKQYQVVIDGRSDILPLNTIKGNRIYVGEIYGNKFHIDALPNSDENLHGLISEKRVKDLAQQLITQTIDNYCPFPLNSIIAFVDNKNPASVFKNTFWQEIATGQTLVGLDVNQVEFNSLNKTGGSKTVKLTFEEMAKHTHVIGSSGNHNHTTDSQGNHYHIVNNHTHYVPPHQHVVPWGEGKFNAGWGIWEAGGGGRHGSGKSDWDNWYMMSSSTDVTTHESAPNTNYNGNHGHNISTNGNHTHSISEIGGDKEHNNLQPYLVVRFWKRIS